MATDIEYELRCAAQYGNLAQVQSYLDRGVNVNCKGYDDHTPLYYAASYGHVDVARLLLEKGANVEACDKSNHYTPLHLVAGNGRLDVAHLLLEKGANVDACDSRGITPLYRAAQGAKSEIVQLLLENGAKIDAKNKDGKTPLEIAEARGFNDPIAQILRDYCREQLFDALREKRMIDVVRILRNSFIHASLRDSTDTPLLHSVVATQDLSLLHTLFQKPDLEIDAQDLTGHTALAVAISTGDAKTALLLHQAGASLALVDESILASALLHAACGNNDRMVAQLLRFGVSPTSPNENGETAWHMAAAHGHMPILTTLLQVATVRDGIDATNHAGESPLFVAASAGHGDVVKALIAANTSPLSITNAGSTLLHAAAIGGNTSVLDHVLPLCSDSMESVDEFGQTPLHVAAAKGHGSAVKYLLDADANILATTKTGATPLMLATHPYAIAVLKRAEGKAKKRTARLSAAVLGQDTTCDRLDGSASCNKALSGPLDRSESTTSGHVARADAVLESVNAGNLRSYLDAKRLGQPTNINVYALNVAWELANTLADLHDNGLVHRDLESYNVLLCADKSIKLANVGGLAHESDATTGKSTPYWTAPEVVASNSNYSAASDIYAFGVILTELDTLHIPFHEAKGLGYWGIIDDVRLGNLRPTVSANCPPWLRDLADACLSFDPTQRPSAPMIVESLQKLLNRSDEEPSVLNVEAPTTKLTEPRVVSSLVSTMSDTNPELLIKPPASVLSVDADTMPAIAAPAPSIVPLASTGAAASCSMLVSTQFMCQLCFASNSLLQTHCESCAEELASTPAKLQVLLKRVVVAKKKGHKIYDGLVCVNCGAQQSMDATACSKCSEALPNEQAKLSILLRRIEKMTKSTA